MSVFCFNIPVEAEAQTVLNPPSTTAKAMILIEKESGRVLAQKNAHTQLSIASTTKIVTALTVLENCDDITRVVEVDKRCVGIEGTSIYLKAGEKLTIEELLYGLMLRSGNDAAVTLAYAISGGIDEFASLMNQTAKKYGAIECNFVNPHGLEQEGHHCSASDLAKITKAGLDNQVFAGIVSSTKYRTASRENTDSRLFQNKNKMLHLYEGSNGVKTGYTKKAGRCLVSSCTRDGMTLISVVLNAPSMWEDSQKLLNYGFENYKIRTIIDEYNVCGVVAVNDGKQPEVELYTMKKFVYPMTEEEYMKVKVYYDYPNVLNAPVGKEQIVGKVSIKLDNDLLFEENIYTINEVESQRIESGLSELIKKWFG